MKHITRSLRVLSGLAVVVGVSSVLGSNNVRSEALKGFGSAATGGLGGEVVQVRSTKALEYELCRSYSFGHCNDNSPREIQVAGTIDFTGTEGQGEGRVADTAVLVRRLIKVSPFSLWTATMRIAMARRRHWSASTGPASAR